MVIRVINLDKKSFSGEISRNQIAVVDECRFRDKMKSMERYRINIINAFKTEIILFILYREKNLSAPISSPDPLSV